jgi:RNA polymerase sigma-B factor
MTLIPLALSLAHRYGRGDGDPESAALLGLARALRGYDPARGTTLRTWVARRIRHELRHTERDASGWGRPRWDEIPRALRLREEWDRLTVAEREWVEAHLPRAHEQQVVSLDAPTLDGEPLGEMIAAVGDGFAVIAERDWVRDLLSRLPRHEREPVELCVMDGLSQAEAGRRLGISQMMISRRVKRALERLRQEVDRC